MSAVKQEIDRNDDMLRSCFRAVAALDGLPGSNNVPAWSAFMKTVVHSPELEVCCRSLGLPCSCEGNGGIRPEIDDSPSKKRA